MDEIGVENDRKSVDYEKTRPLVTCIGPACSNAFRARPGKQYCSARCRARAGDVRRLERILGALKAGSLSDSDIRTLSRMVGKQGVKFRDPKPLRVNKAHLRVLSHIDELPGVLFVPELERLFPSAGRRCRELRAAGVLERVLSGGRYAGFVRRTCPACSCRLCFADELPQARRVPGDDGKVVCPNCDVLLRGE